ncbi:MAG: hypothetical protein ACRELD_02275 [Longimicrobiales bacterium]
MRFRYTLALLTVLATACGGRRPPSADDTPRPAPDLSGRTVMVLPTQTAAGGVALASFDDELRFWLADRGPRVRWTFAAEMERALASAPALQIELNALPVEAFLRAEVKRIGDPLFGDLRRLGALVDARYALLPVAVAYVPAEQGPGRVEVGAALIDTVGGAVLWYGVVGGTRGEATQASVTASAAQALAAAVLR